MESLTGPRRFLTGRTPYWISENTQSSIFNLGKVGHESVLHSCCTSILSGKRKKERKKDPLALSLSRNVSGNENLITAAACQRSHEKEMEDSHQRKLEMSCGTHNSFSFSFALWGNCFHQAVRNIRAHADSILLEFVTNCCGTVLDSTVMCKIWFWRQFVTLQTYIAKKEWAISAVSLINYCTF